MSIILFSIVLWSTIWDYLKRDRKYCRENNKNFRTIYIGNWKLMNWSRYAKV